MAKVYMFPEKKRIPKGMEERLEQIAKDYIDVLFATMAIMSIDDPTTESLDEIHELVANTYAEALNKAIDELREP